MAFDLPRHANLYKYDHLEVYIVMNEELPMHNTNQAFE